MPPRPLRPRAGDAPPARATPGQAPATSHLLRWAVMCPRAGLRAELCLQLDDDGRSRVEACSLHDRWIPPFRCGFDCLADLGLGADA